MLPNFLMIGAARCGTTSLHYYLSQHPEICMSTIKEPNYFLCDRRNGTRPRLLVEHDRRLETKSVLVRADYEMLFRPRPQEWRIGEASPLYLYARETPELIDRETSDALLVAVLRDPIDRAYSHFLHVYRGKASGVESAFAQAVEAEVRLPYTPYRTGTHFLRLGRYSEQLCRYYETFSRQRVLVLLHDDFRTRPAQTMRRLCDFLGVASDFAFDTTTIHNRSGVAANAGRRALRSVAGSVQPWAKGGLPPALAGRLARWRSGFDRPSVRPPLPTWLRRQLASYFADDVAHLEELLQRDLSSWLVGTSRSPQPRFIR
jgi:hypothetical protein